MSALLLFGFCDLLLENFYDSESVNCPTRLYDTLSGFSSQDEGGTILFGVEEQQNFAEIGVYDAQDLMKHVVEQ